MAEISGKSPPAPGRDTAFSDRSDPPEAITPPGLPSRVAGSGTLDRLVETARDYADHATAQNTRRAYADDWKHFARWCRLHGVDALEPDPRAIGLYLTDCARPVDGAPALSVATLERRLAGIGWNYRFRGIAFDRRDRHIAQVFAGIRRMQGTPPRQKAAVSADEILAMVTTLGFDLRGLRDRAILLIGFAAGARRSEIVGLDIGRGDTFEGTGWIEIQEAGALLTLRGKTGWREIAVGRGSSPRSCPIQALETWLEFGKIDFGPAFRRVSRDGLHVLDDRLSGKHVARLVKQTILAAGLRPDLPVAERVALYSGHSLRSGLASHAEVEEAHIQRHLGHASAEMTRRYQRRRDRFRVNLTKAAGL